LTPDAEVDELLGLVHFGPIEDVSVKPGLGCVFISFLEGATAAAFLADAKVKKLALRGIGLTVGRSERHSPVSQAVGNAVATVGACRVVYIGDIPPEFSESDLQDRLRMYGPIDQIKIVRDRASAFVHFLSISLAMRVSIPDEYS
jgi:hypothetical protein